ncbi:MAG: SpoIVB peptidase [Clostridium perfringens]|nr:SpoIVB peptidase [Clostridium perfringens]
MKNNFSKKRLRIVSLVIITFILILTSFCTLQTEIFNLFYSNVNKEVGLRISQNNEGNGSIGNINRLNANNYYGNEDIEVYAGGTPVGVKISTDGVLAVGYSDINIDSNSIESPAKKYGIELGDILLEVNSQKIESSKDLSKKLNKIKKEQVEILINRDGNQIKKTVSLFKTETGTYKLGLWVRDSTAGVGTMTFYHKGTNIYGALGHPITDNETEKILSVKSGELIESSIISVRKGQRGTPGELKGVFINTDNAIGNVLSNTQCGIFGKINDENNIINMNNLYKVGYKNEVKLGKAQIISTIDENGPKFYDVEIIKVINQDLPSSKSMVIKVIDPLLLEKTGGIVQGMSGSPIIQNNKVIGAVTHVLVNKPEVGYGIYIEWMLKDANIIK